MADPVPSPYLVPFDGSFRIAASPTEPPTDAPKKGTCRDRLHELKDELDRLQRLLYAFDRHAVLLVFQAMDAAGKDGTIRALTSGIDAAGFQVSSFKAPSSEELDHDFLWRGARRLPERGRIGIFNRSYYEEVLVVRVHGELLDRQQLPDVSADVWAGRYESIRDHEKHLARNGTAILKFFLNVSWAKQRKRFLDRIDKPEKNWKFCGRDVEERAFWGDYMCAYEAALNETSRPWAPWYAIPADNKPYMRMVVTEIVVGALRSLGLRYPTLDEEGRAELKAMRKRLEGEPGAADARA